MADTTQVDEDLAEDPIPEDPAEDADRITGTHANGEEFILLGPPDALKEIKKVAARIERSGWKTFRQGRSAAGVAPDLAAIRAAVGETPDK